jgi:hypothetical protein
MTELFDPAALVDTADDPGRYVERYRFSGLLVGALVFWVAVGGVSAWLAVGAAREFLRERTAEPPAPGADLLVLGAGTAALAFIACAVAVFVGRWIHAAATHRVAFRADRDGVTLGSQPYPLARAVTVPWRDLAQIEVSLGYAPIAWSIGLTLRRGAPRPRGIPRPGSARAVVYKIRQWWLYSSSGDVSHLIQGWTLDRVRLVAAITTYSPRTPFIGF